jgi:putative lipoprotein
MNRIRSIIAVGLVPLALLAAAYTSSAPALPSAEAPQPTPTSAPAQPTAVRGTVTYREVLALAADARITVQLVEISHVDGSEVVIAGQTLELAGGHIPFEFEIGFDTTAIRPNGVYVVDASMVADGKVLYATTTRLNVITQGHPTMVNLALAKVDPWSPLELALSSGRLGPHSYQRP